MLLRQPCHLLLFISHIGSPSRSGLEFQPSSCVCAVQPLALHYFVVDHFMRAAALIVPLRKHPTTEHENSPFSSSGQRFPSWLPAPELLASSFCSSLFVCLPRHTVLMLMTLLATSGRVPGPHELVGEPQRIPASSEPGQWIMSDLPGSCMCTTCRDSRTAWGEVPTNMFVIGTRTQDHPSLDFIPCL